MADPEDKTSVLEENEADQIQSQQEKLGPNPSPGLRLLNIRELLSEAGKNVIVYDIEKAGFAANSLGSLDVSAKAKVFLHGTGLKNYNKVFLNIGEDAYSPIDLKIIDREISFYFPDFDKLLSDGYPIYLEFYSDKNPRLSFRLKQQLFYVLTQEQPQDESASEKSKEQKSTTYAEGEEQKTATAVGSLVGIGGQIMSMAVGPFVPDSIKKLLRLNLKESLKKKDQNALKESVKEAVRKGDIGAIKRALRDTQDPQMKEVLEKGIEDFENSKFEPRKIDPKEDTRADVLNKVQELEEELGSVNLGDDESDLENSYLTAKDATEILSEYINENESLIPDTSIRSSIVTALQTGNFSTLSQNSNEVLQQVISQTQTVSANLAVASQAVSKLVSSSQVVGSSVTSSQGSVQVNANVGVKQEMEIVRKYVEQNPQVIVNTELRGRVLSALASGQTGGLNPEVTLALSGALSVSAGTPAGVLEALAKIQTAISTEVEISARPSSATQKPQTQGSAKTQGGKPLEGSVSPGLSIGANLASSTGASPAQTAFSGVTGGGLGSINNKQAEQATGNIQQREASNAPSVSGAGQGLTNSGMPTQGTGTGEESLNDQTTALRQGKVDGISGKPLEQASLTQDPKAGINFEQKAISKQYVDLLAKLGKRPEGLGKDLRQGGLPNVNGSRGESVEGGVLGKVNNLQSPKNLDSATQVGGLKQSGGSLDSEDDSDLPTSKKSQASEDETTADQNLPSSKLSDFQKPDNSESQSDQAQEVPKAQTPEQETDPKTFEQEPEQAEGLEPEEALPESESSLPQAGKKASSLLKKLKNLKKLEGLAKTGATVAEGAEATAATVSFLATTWPWILGFLAVVLLILFFIAGTCSYFSSKAERYLLAQFGLDSICEIWDQTLVGQEVNSKLQNPEQLNTSSATCSPLLEGPASLQSLQSTCLSASAPLASMIAKLESGGNPAIASTVDVCRDQNNNPRKIDGKDMSVSWGLFQINLTAHKIGNLDCPKAFDRMYTPQNKQCNVVDLELYRRCVEAAKDPVKHIQQVCVISKNGTDWNPWSADRKKCSF